jgi:MEDS: MEthanogen/methylotroph, DcmR Sensory domain
MNAKKTSYHPVKFLDQLEGNKHLVMLYDNERYADVIIARYCLNNLESGGSCVFFTEDDPKVMRKRLIASGLDVDKYERANSFRFFQTPKPREGKVDFLSILRFLRSESAKGMKPPFRFVGRTIRDIESKEGMRSGLALEKIGQEHFEEFDNAQLCYYDIRKMEQSRRDKWIEGLLENHHQVIYASKPDKAVAFETDLLE